MFETLYKDPATIAKYRLAPLLEDRERYLLSMVASGAAGAVVCRAARTQLVLMDLLNLPDADIPVRLATVETVVQERCRSVPRFLPRISGAMPFAGCVSSAGWMSRSGTPIRTSDRWRPSRPGCGTIGGCLK